MCDIHRDMMVPATKLTFIAFKLYKGKMDEKGREELSEIINGIRSSLALLRQTEGGSATYLAEFNWFLEWAKVEGYQTPEQALEAITKAASAKELETKESLLHRLLTHLALQADGAWDQQARRECEGDD